MTDEPTNPDDSRVEVLPVPEGSIIWVHNIDADPSVLDGLGKQLHDRIGHDRFLVIYTQGDGTVKVYGDGDLDAITERVRSAIAPTNVVEVGVENKPTCGFCGAAVEWVDLDVPTESDGSALQRNIPCGHIMERTGG